MIATTTSSGFDPETFVLGSGLLEQWTIEGRNCSIRCALRNAGFECRRLQRVLPHHLVIVDGDCDRTLEFRPARAIKAAVLKSFHQHALMVRSSFYSIRGAGTKLVVSLAVFE